MIYRSGLAVLDIRKSAIMKGFIFSAIVLCVWMTICSCGREKEPENVQTGWIAEQLLKGETGEIHYSYYLPKILFEDASILNWMIAHHKNERRRPI